MTGRARPLRAVGSAEAMSAVPEPVADPRRVLAPIPRLALKREEAAESLGMSLRSFEEHVQPTLRLVRLGRMRLVPIAELERWLADNAETVLGR